MCFVPADGWFRHARAQLPRNQAITIGSDRAILHVSFIRFRGRANVQVRMELNV